MKKFILPLAVLASVSLVSCGGADEAEENEEDATEESAKVEETTTEEVETPVQYVANETIAMEIEGMKCAINCKGSVEKCIKNTAGVAEFNVEFDKENPSNKAMISFDNSVTSAEEIKAAIEATNDGAYKVIATEKVEG